MNKKWLKKKLPHEEETNALAEQLKIDPSIANLLLLRNINTLDKAKRFFRPDLNNLYDPFLMKDMHKAVATIDEYMRNHSAILIYGDYDVDGTTAVSLLYSFLAKSYDKLDYYIPDRHSEGYGLSFEAIDWCVENNFKLIITLDCGITANEQVAYAKEKGIEVVISDHHLPGETLPEARAILNPKQADCPYPFKELSGAGIGFKLAQAFTQHNDLPVDALYGFLDLVAVSIASDMVPIEDENRILAYNGLKKLNENPSVGLKAIKDLAVDKPDISILDIILHIGPRINAAGRMGDAEKAVKLLIAREQVDADIKAEFINITNAERRNVDASITKEAMTLMRNSPELQAKKSTVLYGEGWHKGVIGIVASRLMETYYRPTIVFTQNEGVLTGSARSVNGFDIYAAISECSDLIDQFGGHKYAAGLTLPEHNIAEFTRRFEEVVAGSIREDQLYPKIDIDVTLEFNQINGKFLRILKQFGPFGPGNPQPIFVSHNVYANRYIRIVGENHIQVTVEQDNNSHVFQAIAFNQSEHFGLMSKGVPFSICYTIEENVFKGKTSTKLYIKDIKFSFD